MLLSHYLVCRRICNACNHLYVSKMLQRGYLKAVQACTLSTFVWPIDWGNVFCLFFRTILVKKELFRGSYKNFFVLLQKFFVELLKCFVVWISHEHKCAEMVEYVFMHNKFRSSWFVSNAPSYIILFHGDNSMNTTTSIRL